MATPPRTRPVAILVTPGAPAANNGNWRTARRWAGFLAGIARPIVQTAWDGKDAAVLIALHARKSAESIARFKAAFAHRPLVVVMTGTDLYRDLAAGPDVRHSLALADRIVVLQEDALGHVPREFRRKCVVIHQSANALPARAKPRGRLECAVVGHLREEKDPRTLWRALELLDPGLPITIRHVGEALDPALEREARATMARDPRYRWIGALPHGFARGVIRRAHLLVHPSVLEGGANVIVEAVLSGTPVLASRVSGNVGMLGPRYPGYFEVGDAKGLARALARLCAAPSALRSLATACRERRALFTPAAERAAVRALVVAPERKARR
jgi:putative glycosyltransferase (TIGR04348 family)